MNNKIAIKNFRAFNNVGAELEVRPITVLTGCNSSGKSSFVKALVLLNNIFKNNDGADLLKHARLDFTDGTLSLLGDITTVLNDEAAKNGEDIEITYDVTSPMLMAKYSVNMCFGTQPNDRLNNGHLKSLVIKDADGNYVWGNRSFEEQRGISVLKSRFLGFYGVMYILKTLEAMYYEEVGVIEGSIDDDRDVLLETIKNIGKEHGKETVVALLSYYTKYSSFSSMPNIRAWMKDNCSFFEEALEHNILTYSPLLAIINEFPKEAFAEKFNELFDGYFNGFAKISSSDDTELIIQSFLKSKYDSFIDFYRDLEDEFLDGQITPVLSGTKKDCLGLNLDQLKSRSSSIFADIIWDLKTPHIMDREVTLFEKVFHTLSYFNHCRKVTDLGNIVDRGDDFFDRRYTSVIYEEFKKYVKQGLSDLLSENICEDIRYVGSARIDIKRLYSLDYSDDFTRTLAEYFEAIRVYNPHYVLNYTPNTFINRWLQRFGIGDRIEIQPIGAGLGAIPIIYKDAEDQKGRALADFGYGISQLISVLLEIETSIITGEPMPVRNFIISKDPLHVNFTKVFGATDEYVYKPKTIAIEEPEIHLHPKYQSLLAEMFVEAYNEYGINFIIETHSEYLVRKLQTLVAKKDIDKEQVSLIYVESVASSEKKVRRIEINDDGCLKEAFGEGFFDEADNLAMNLLLIKGGLA